MRRARALAVVTVMVLGVVAAVAMAQGPPPSVPVTASPSSVAVGASGPVPSGPTRFQITKEASERGLDVFFGLLVPGVSLEQFQAALRNDDRTGGTSTLGLVSVQASVSLAGPQTSGGVTFNLKPGVTYVLLSEPETDGPGGPPSRGITTFTTSAASNGAAAPAAAATIRMAGLRFTGSRVLPRRGTVRVENVDGAAHFAIAFPLRRRATPAQFGRAIRRDNERALERLLQGPPVGVQNIISGGDVVNYQDLEFPRAGRYGLVCFLDEHHKLGMYRVVRVR